MKNHATGYKKWWDCEDMELSAEDCQYKLLTVGRDFYVNEPIQGTVRIGKGEISGNWQNCGKRSYRTENPKECAVKIKNIWPGTVTRIKIELLHPPKYSGEYAAVELENVAPTAFYFTTETKEPSERNKEETNKFYSQSKMKHICWGDIEKCKKLYSGGTTANIAGSTTNSFLSKSWSKSVTLKLQNRHDKLPLQDKMYYKMKAVLKSSTIWRRYLGINAYYPPFQQKQLIFNLKAPMMEMLQLECEFEPKQVMVGQNVEVFVSVKNKQNGFRRAKLKAIYKSESRLESEHQQIDVILTPVGNGNGNSDNIGLEPIKNVVQIRKRGLINIGKLDTTPAKFKVLSVGKQCVSFEITGAGKRFYQQKQPECMDVVGELAAEYAEDNDEKINKIYNDQESDKFEFVIKTGSEASLQGEVAFTPVISGIKPYQITIDPGVISTGSCKRDCILPFDITPKIPCAFDENSNEFKVNGEIAWTASYVANGRNVYFPDPAPIKLVIMEREFDDSDDLDKFKEEYPEKYVRWQKCQDSMKDINPMLPCDQADKKGTDSSESDKDGIIPTDCIPSDEIDSDDEILKEIENEHIESKKLKWYEDFWQYNWNWQYLVLGSATVMIGFGILTQLGCVGNQSLILEMLENLNVEQS